MGNSNQVTVGGLRDREKQRIVTEADEQGLDQAEYVRQRFRAGMLIWDQSGGFDIERLTDLSSGELPSSRSESTTTGTTEVSDIASVIKTNLATDEPTPLESDSEEDLIDIVVEQVITDALSELMDEGEIKNVPGQGYQRK